MSKRQKRTKGVEAYPWDMWFKQKVFTIKSGIDYRCFTHSMLIQIRQQARKRGVKVSISTEEKALKNRIMVVLTTEVKD